MRCDDPRTHKLSTPIFSGLDMITHIPLRCGKCLPCITARIQGWAFRIEKETEKCESAYFVTLTYDNIFVPTTDRNFMTLRKTDVQDFMKRLRYYHNEKFKKKIIDHEDLRAKKFSTTFNKQKISYYAVGEYGAAHKRPHYHAIIFNTTKNSIAEAWPYGTIHIDDCNLNTIFYTLKYMEKPQTKHLHKGFDGKKEFSLCSKGLGEDYLTRTMIAWHKSNPDNNFLLTKRGFRIPIPKYYYDKIWTVKKWDHFGENNIPDYEGKKEMIKHIKLKTEEYDKKFLELHQRQNTNAYVFMQIAKLARFDRLNSSSRRYID